MSKDEKLPKFPVAVTLTKKKLTVYAGLEKLELPVSKGEIDLIQLDVWISDILYHVSRGADDKPKNIILS